jgi:hypothetical protein
MSLFRLPSLALSRSLSSCRPHFSSSLRSPLTLSLFSSFGTISAIHESEKTVISSFRVFKTKCALQVSLTSTTMIPSRTGNRFFKQRSGNLVLEFASPVPESTDNNKQTTTNPSNYRSYDWNSTVSIYLSPNELGEIIAFHTLCRDAAECKFFHDPGMNSQQQGEIRKEFVIRRSGNGKGYFFNLTQTSKESGKISHSLPLTEGEMTIIVTLGQRYLPEMLGFYDVVPVMDKNGNN